MMRSDETRGAVGAGKRPFVATAIFVGAALFVLLGIHLSPAPAAPPPSALSVFLTTTPTFTPVAEPTPTLTSVEPTPTLTSVEPTPTPTGIVEPTPTLTGEPTPTLTGEPTPTLTGEPTPTLTAEPSPTPTEPVEPTPTSTPPAPIEPTPAPGRFRVAFFADTGYAEITAEEAQIPGDYDDPTLDLPARTLKLVYAEGADVALVGGDLGYDYPGVPAIPEKWDRMISMILGADYPLFVTQGNHDVRDWDSADADSANGYAGLGYRDLMKQRWEAVENSAVADDFECTFASGPEDIGTKSTCVYKGALTFISSGLGAGNGIDPTDFGSPDNAFEAYLKSELDKSTTPWTVCNWHFNQTLFQTGDKRDEAGWKPYEYCREAGALIATGHEHAYSRTSVLTRFGLDSNPSHIVDVGHELTIAEGRTLAWVSGLGGQSIRSASSWASMPWWEAIVTSDTQPRADGAGVLFCDFSATENANANCFFKTVDGVVQDRFELVSQANGNTGTFVEVLDGPNVAPIAYDLTVSGAVGLPIEPAKILTSDGDGPDAVEFWSNDLPRGISMNRSTGTFTGAPSQAGTISSTVFVWDGADSTPVSVTFDIEPETLSAEAVSYCVNEAGWVDVRVINASASFSRTATVSVSGLDTRTVSLAPNSEELVRRTGRPNGRLSIIVTNESGARILDTQVEVDCLPPLKVSCLAGNGRIDAYLYNRGSSSATYRVAVGNLAPRLRVVAPTQTTRVTITGRPDGPLPVQIIRNGTTELAETVTVACDPRPPGGYEITTSCLASNGRVDVHLWNDRQTLGTYAVTVGSLAPRTRALAPGATNRITVTGRPDGTIPITITRNGAPFRTESRVIRCD